MSGDVVNSKTGEVFNSSDFKALIDYSKIDTFKQNFGFYQIVSSELTLSEKEIIDKYHGLTQIENQFRIMKSSLETRPLFVRNPDHIRAHLLVCMIALLIVRIIQNKIIDSSPKDTSNLYWSSGMNADKLISALKEWNVELLPGDFYKFSNIDNTDLKTILDAFNIQIPLKLFRRMELKNIKTNIDIFT